MKFLSILFTLSIIFSVNSQEKSENYKKGTEYFTQENYEKALNCFDKEKKTNNSQEIKFWIASCYFKMKQMQIAKSKFLEIINNPSEGPEISMSMINLGSCYRDLKQIDSAFFYYNKTIKEFPKLASAYFNKAQLLYSQSKFEEALKEYNSAIELDSSDWWYYQKRLEVSFASQNYESALKDLLKVKELNPKTSNEMNFAYCYSMLKRYKEADSIFQIIYNDKDPFFLNNYGLNKHYLGESEKGIEIIFNSILLDKNNSYAYRNLAIISIDQNDIQKACNYLNQAKNLNFRNNYGDEVDTLISENCK